MISCSQHSLDRLFALLRRTAPALIVSLVLCACAGLPPQPPAPPDMPPSQRPYQIYGVWYYPIASARGYREEGIASWYGDDFHGKATSSGEPYNMYGMTAAHKTLPLGTHVKVTNKTSGESIILRINDRGPFVAGRIIDLSYTAARKLGMIGPGTVPVRVEAVRIARPTERAGKPAWTAETVPDFRIGNFSIQLGAFQDIANAQKLRRLMLQKYEQVTIQPPAPQGPDRLYRVQVGPYTDLLRARQEAERLQFGGYTGAFVVAADDATG